MICFLPKYCNSNPHHTEKLPIWHDENDNDTRPIDTPVTVLGCLDSAEKTLPPSMRSRDSSHGFDPEKALPQVESDRSLKPASNPPKISIMDLIPLLRFCRWLGRKIFKLPHSSKPKKWGKPHIDYVESNIPLEIILVLSK